MSMDEKRIAGVDSGHILYLPRGWRYTLFGLLALLGAVALLGSGYYLLADRASDRVVSLMTVAQTAIGGAVVVLVVMFSERQLNTARLHEKTNEFLEKHLLESLRRIELPQIRKEATVEVREITRPKHIYGRRKDIYGINYELSLDDFRMKMWVGINVRRLSVIYFVGATDEADAKRYEDLFKFTFGGAKKVGYTTNHEFAIIDEEPVVSIWSTVFAEHAVLGNPAEQLFWTQDIAMMTQSVARTASRNKLSLYTQVDPAPL